MLAKQFNLSAPDATATLCKKCAAAMLATFRKTRFSSALFALLVILTAFAADLRAQPAKPLPTFAVVERTVVQYFATLADYKSGTLITRGQIEPLFDLLAKQGWVVADRKTILDLVPADDGFLASQLKTSGGQKMMDQLADSPAGYDRLDRLSRLPRGKQTVRDLVKGPDGYKLLDYMTQTAGGEELGKMLSEDPHGQNFNQPTGRIYTDRELLARLKLSYDAASAAEQKASK